MRRLWRLEMLPLCLLGVVLAVLFWRLWLGEAFFWGLPLVQFVPWRAYGVDALRAGHLPLWNPYNGAGAPLFANYQSSYLYPLNWLHLLVRSYAAVGWLSSVLAVMHLFLAGLGMWLYAGRLGVPVLGRGVMTLAYALSTYMVGRLGTFPIGQVYAWIPWLLWSVDGVVRPGQLRHYLVLSLVVGVMLLGGHAQTAWYGLLLAGAYAAWRAFRPGFPVRRMPLALLAVLLGVGLGAFQLLSTYDLTAASARSDGYGSEADVFRYQYSLTRSLNILAPNFFGNPGNGTYLGRGIPYEFGAYVGLMTVTGAFVAVLALFLAHDRQNAHLADVPFWLGIFIVGFIFSLGDGTPIFPWLYRHVSTFDMFQAPVRWHVWTVFALTVLGGIGTASWGQGERVVFWTRLATAGAAGGCVLVMVAPSLLPDEIVETEGVLTLVNAIGMTFVWVMLAGVLTLLHAANVPKRFKPLPAWWGRGWASMVLVVLAFDLGWAGRGLNPTQTASLFERNEGVAANLVAGDTRGFWPSDTLDLLVFGQLAGDEGEVEVFDPDDLGFSPYLYPADYRILQTRVDAFRALPIGNVNLLDRVYLLNNNEPLVLNSYANLVDRLNLESDEAQAAVFELPDAGVSTLFSVTSAGVVESFEVTTAGRAYVTDDDGKILMEMLSVTDTYNRTHVVVPEIEELEQVTLVLQDTYTPDWRAYVDGQALNVESDVLGSGRVLRQVPVGSEIEFVYRPWWVLPGSLISGLSTFSLVFLGVFEWRRASRRSLGTMADNAA